MEPIDMRQGSEKYSDMRQGYFLNSTCDMAINKRQRHATLTFLKIDTRHWGPPVKGPIHCMVPGKSHGQVSWQTTQGSYHDRHYTKGHDTSTNLTVESSRVGTSWYMCHRPTTRFSFNLVLLPTVWSGQGPLTTQQLCWVG